MPINFYSQEFIDGGEDTALPTGWLESTLLKSQGQVTCLGHQSRTEDGIRSESEGVSVSDTTWEGFQGSRTGKRTI